MKKKILIALAAAVMAIPLAGCTTTATSAGKPVPEMTFAQLAPFYVNAHTISIETSYDPMADRDDIASTFPTPPDIALRRYAEVRLRPAASGQGILHYVIEDARVDYSNFRVQGHLAELIHNNGRDRYDVRMKLRLYKTFPDGSISQQVTLTLERPLTLPESMSVAEREMAQFKFLEEMMKDVDVAVVNALQQRLNVGVPYSAATR